MRGWQAAAGVEGKHSVRTRRGGGGGGGASCDWGQTAGWPEEPLLDVIRGPNAPSAG